MIEFKNVKKYYLIGNDTLEVLKGIDLKIESGEFCAIMGPSGSGKSTIMNIMGCLDKVTTGNFLFNGKDITNYNDEELAQIRNAGIGFVFQNFHLLPRLNAISNIELPMIYAGLPKKERKNIALDALVKVGLSSKANSFPHELSGGQKQRIAIARALVNNPKVILADEPTGALDSATSQSIMNIFTELNKKGTTIIVITHELEVANYAYNLVNVRDGMISINNGAPKHEIQ